MSCCVVGCRNRASKCPNMKFFRVPKGERPFNANRRRLWLQAIKRVDWTPTVINNARVCGAHFISGQASMDYYSPDFVPSLFNYTKPSKRPAAKLERMLELNARDTPSLRDDDDDDDDDGGAMGGAAGVKTPKASLSDTEGKSTSQCSPAPIPTVCKPTKARIDTSLVLLTRRFADLVKHSSDRVFCLNVIAEELNVKKRRIYDLVNVLQGVKLVKKKSKNCIEWIGCDLTGNFEEELKELIVEEERLDQLIESCMLQIHLKFENKSFQRMAYVSYDDIRGIPSFKEQTVILIKAPSETKLEVPHPAESLQVHLRSTEGPIEAYVCSDHPVNTKTEPSANDGQFGSSANGNRAAPLSPCLWNSKDHAKHTSRINTSDPPTMPTQHTPPASVIPASPEDQQSFVTLSPSLAFSLGGQEYLLSLAHNQGIPDLFSYVDRQPLQLDTPR